jgi:hypothetical protein
MDTFINSDTGSLTSSLTQPFNYTFDPATDNLPTSGIGGEFRMASNPAGDSSAVM